MEKTLLHSTEQFQQGWQDITFGAGVIALGLANIPLFLNASPKMENIINTTDNPIVGLGTLIAVLADGGASLLLPFMGAVMIGKGAITLGLAAGSRFFESRLQPRRSGNVRIT